MAAAGGLFFLRVIGQVLVTYRKVKWLPPVEHWQSGLLPVPGAAGSQAAILGTMGAMIAGGLARAGPVRAACVPGSGGGSVSSAASISRR